jgi:hypothetical protein
MQNSLVKIFQDSNANLSFSRLLDLVSRVERTLPEEFLEMVKGKIYKSVLSYGNNITSLPSQEDWYNFIDDYSFCWIFFIIQEVSYYPKEIFPNLH